MNENTYNPFTTPSIYDRMSDYDLEIVYFLDEINNAFGLLDTDADQIEIMKEWDVCWTHLESLGVSINMLQTQQGTLAWMGPMKLPLLAWKGATLYPDEGSDEHFDILAHTFRQKFCALKNGTTRI